MNKQQWAKLNDILAAVRKTHSVTPETGAKLTALLATMSNRDKMDFLGALQDTLAAANAKKANEIQP